MSACTCTHAPEQHAAVGCGVYHCGCMASRLDMANAEGERLSAAFHRENTARLNAEEERDALREGVDCATNTNVRLLQELIKTGQHAVDLLHVIEGARDSFLAIRKRLEWPPFDACGCAPGIMCVPCELDEAVRAMESALRGDPIPPIGEDSPEDIELARKAFGAALEKVPDVPSVPPDDPWPPSPQERKGKTE